MSAANSTQKLQQEIIMRAHIDFTGGHLRRVKTQDQVRRRAFWKGWREDLRRYCERCPDSIHYHRVGPPRHSFTKDDCRGP